MKTTQEYIDDIIETIDTFGCSSEVMSTTRNIGTTNVDIKSTFYKEGFDAGYFNMKSFTHHIKRVLRESGVGFLNNMDVPVRKYKMVGGKRIMDGYLRNTVYIQITLIK